MLLLSLTRGPPLPLSCQMSLLFLPATAASMVADWPSPVPPPLPPLPAAAGRRKAIVARSRVPLLSRLTPQTSLQHGPPRRSVHVHRRHPSPPWPSFPSPLVGIPVHRSPERPCPRARGKENPLVRMRERFWGELHLPLYVEGVSVIFGDQLINGDGMRELPEQDF
jgi:hypothetical protein